MPSGRARVSEPGVRAGGPNSESLSDRTDMSRRSRRLDQRDQAEPERSAPPPVKPWSETGDETFGNWLRRQREVRKIGLREISDRTKIGMRYLEALEESRFDLLPAPIFARGFLREYSKFVGLDPDEVVNFYLAAAQGQDDEEPELTIPSTAAEGMWRTLAILAMVVAILLLIVLGLAYLNDKRQTDQAEDRPGIAPPVIEVPELLPPTDPELQTPVAPLTVSLSFTDECWVEAQIDGEHRVSELRVQGESMLLEAADRVVLTLGNAAAVRVEVNGSPLVLDAAPGEVIQELTIDRNTVGLDPETVS